MFFKFGLVTTNDGQLAAWYLMLWGHSFQPSFPIFSGLPPPASLDPTQCDWIWKIQNHVGNIREIHGNPRAICAVDIQLLQTSTNNIQPATVGNLMGTQGSKGSILLTASLTGRFQLISALSQINMIYLASLTTLSVHRCNVVLCLQQACWNWTKWCRKKGYEKWYHCAQICPNAMNTDLLHHASLQISIYIWFEQKQQCSELHSYSMSA